MRRDLNPRTERMAEKMMTSPFKKKKEPPKPVTAQPQGRLIEMPYGVSYFRKFPTCKD